MDASSINIPGSFRDTSGRVLEYDGRIFRAISEEGLRKFQTVLKNGIIEDYIKEGKLVSFRNITDEAKSLGIDAPLVLEHPRLPYISYPYEWPFFLLKDAALFHLRLQLNALDRDISFSDASAYNVQFIGTEPIFIDHLSLVPYKEGEYWLAHRQFCEQFLNPLLLRSIFDIPHNEWMQGSLEGISSEHYRSEC